MRPMWRGKFDATRVASDRSKRRVIAHAEPQRGEPRA